MGRRDLLALLTAASWLRSQEHPEKPSIGEPPDYHFYSGTITEIGEGFFIVRRQLPDRDPEDRRFVLNDDTKVEGTLKEKARVTVAYLEEEDGAIARRVVVRT